MGGARETSALSRFKLLDEKGTVLVLKNDGHREAIHPCRNLTPYILNHAGRHQFARKVRALDLVWQAIVSVCG